MPTKHSHRTFTAPGVFAYLFALFIACSACQADTPQVTAPIALPPILIGTWQVIEVHTDQGKSNWSQTRKDKYNINKFLGRIFTYSLQQVTTNSPSDKLCEKPRIIVHHSTAAKVIDTSMASRPFDENRPTPKDFRLPLADNAQVEVLSILCKDGLFAKGLGGTLGSNVGINGAWLIILNQQKLALRWNDETILILRPLAVHTKPVASFNCAKQSR